MLTWISGRAPIAGGTCRSPAPATVRDLAKAERINEFYLGRILRLTLLSPSIMEATPHINNVELGKHGRYRTNVWSYAGVNSFGGERAELGLHPTVKPVAIVADAIRDCSHRKGIVLDAFIGSGTTLIAAERTGRRGYGIEIDPAYCDVAVRRLHAVCGLEAVLEETGQRFAEVEAERLTRESVDTLPQPD
jgi:hypothetical protein